MTSAVRRSLIAILPLAGLVIVAALPLVRYVQKNAAERAAVEALQRVLDAQHAIQRATGSHAWDLRSLTAPCPGQTHAALAPAVLEGIAAAGYTLTLRARQGVTAGGVDCHQRETGRDFYVSVQPAGAASAGQRAYAATGRGRIYLFYDGIPPTESDFGPLGLATPLDGAATFRIP